MLIISRKKHQKIIVADEIEITILEVGRNRVRFGIKAPKHISIQTRLKTSLDDQVPVDQTAMEVEVKQQRVHAVPVLPAAAASAGRR